MKLIAIDLKLQAKLKVSIMIPPTLWPSAAWGSQRWTILRFEGRKVFRWELWWRGPEWGWPGQGAQARPWLPALASNSKISLQTPSGSPPPRAPGCWGPHSGWNHNWNFKFCLQFQIICNELRDEVLEIFFAIEIRAGFNPLIALSLIFLLSPNHNLHIYVL